MLRKKKNTKNNSEKIKINVLKHERELVIRNSDIALRQIEKENKH